jgi:hypothetical protein
MNWHKLDAQMRRFSPQLIAEVGLTPEAAGKLATTIAADVRFLSTDDKAKIRNASPVPLQNRLDELSAFQSWTEQAAGIRNNPAVTRAHVQTQNYVCFVYLSESCFRVLAKAAPSDSAARKCARFLSNNPIRAFRNAIAHANWAYRQPDHEAIIYWARKGADPSEPLATFEVKQEDLDFWQALARCVAYAAFSNL